MSNFYNSLRDYSWGYVPSELSYFIYLIYVVASYYTNMELKQNELLTNKVLYIYVQISNGKLLKIWEFAILWVLKYSQFPNRVINISIIISLFMRKTSVKPGIFSGRLAVKSKICYHRHFKNLQMNNDTYNTKLCILDGRIIKKILNGQ